MPDVDRTGQDRDCPDAEPDVRLGRTWVWTYGRGGRQQDDRRDADRIRLADADGMDREQVRRTQPQPRQGALGEAFGPCRA